MIFDRFSAPPTITRVGDSATAVTLAVANPARRELCIYNDSSSAMYMKFGSAATSTDFTLQMAPFSFYEMPLPIYQGLITGIWTTDAGGAAQVTEGV